MAHKARRRATACPTMGLWRATDSNMGVTDSVSTWGCLGNNIDAPDAVYKIDATYEGSCIDFWSRHRLRFPKHPWCIDFVSQTSPGASISFSKIVRCIDFVSQTSSGASMLFPKQPQVQHFFEPTSTVSLILLTMMVMIDDHTSHSWVHLPQT